MVAAVYPAIPALITALTCGGGGWRGGEEGPLMMTLPIVVFAKGA